jgi:hypothetical protein
MADRPVIVHERHPSKIKRKLKQESVPAVNRPAVVYATKPKRRFGILVKVSADQSKGEK